MKIQDTVSRLIALVEAGKNVQAEEELYAQDVVSYEQDGTVAKGLPAIIEKTKASAAYFDAFHGTKITKAFVGADTFLLEFTMDATPKGGSRMDLVEYGYYRVNGDGKVVEERFFMAPFARS